MNELKEHIFERASIDDIADIWVIISAAIQRRKNEGSNQWQDGYPNIEVITKDVAEGYGYVLKINKKIVTYCAIIINYEPEYENIDGIWLTNSDFIVVHRIAVSENYLGLGLSIRILQYVEEIARKLNVFSVKLDTNHDNFAMLKILEKLNFTYCGIVHFRGSPRKAFEKTLQ